MEALLVAVGRDCKERKAQGFLGEDSFTLWPQG
jgi:hypothetical protein